MTAKGGRKEVKKIVDYNNCVGFPEWKKRLIIIHEENGYFPKAIKSIDWKEWKTLYFDEGYSPEDAFAEDQAE